MNIFFSDGSTACNKWGKFNMGTFTSGPKSNEKWIKETYPKRPCSVSTPLVGEGGRRQGVGGAEGRGGWRRWEKRQGLGGGMEVSFDVSSFQLHVNRLNMAPFRLWLQEVPIYQRQGCVNLEK